MGETAGMQYSYCRPDHGPIPDCHEGVLTNKRLAAELESALQRSLEWVVNKRPTPTPPEPRTQGETRGASLQARRKQYKGLTVFPGRNTVLPGPTGQLEDYFVLGEELGRGHFGVVRLCVERSSGSLWACKSLNKNRFRTCEEMDEVRRELAVMHHLSGHANVVGLKAAYEDATHVHLVMELCQGGELFDLINATGSFPEAEAAKIFGELTEVVAYCHSKGVMHRDLKPENILLVDKARQSGRSGKIFGDALEANGLRRPKIKLADFGLAVFCQPGQKVLGMAGSPLYLAPEVLKGSYGHAADVWSLGVILYILLSGAAPFCGDSDLETLKQIEAGQLDFTTAAWKAVPEAAIDLVRRMLNLDPSQRPTAGEVLEHPWLLAHSPCLDLPTFVWANEGAPPGTAQQVASCPRLAATPVFRFGEASTAERMLPTPPVLSPTNQKTPAFVPAPAESSPFSFVFSSTPSPIASPRDSHMLAQKRVQIEKLTQSLLAIQFLTPAGTPVASPVGRSSPPSLPPFSSPNPLFTSGLPPVSPNSQWSPSSRPPFRPTALEIGGSACEEGHYSDDLGQHSGWKKGEPGCRKGAYSGGGLGSGLESDADEGSDSEGGSGLTGSPRGPLEFDSVQPMWRHH